MVPPPDPPPGAPPPEPPPPPPPPPKAKDIETSTPKDDKDASKGFKNVDEELEALRGSIKKLSGARVMDPNLTANIEVEPAKSPSPGAPTTAPNRFTVHVPYANTVLSLGKGGDARVTEDDGIRGRTDKHIQWFTRDTKTYVRIGAKSTAPEASFLARLAGALTTPREIDADGFLMRTSGQAFEESEGHFRVLSKSGDIAINTLGADRTASLQADHGYVEVVAGKQSTVAAGNKVFIVAGDVVGAEPVEAGADFKHMASAKTASFVIKSLMSLGDCLASGLSLYKTFRPDAYGAESKTPAWKTEPNKDWPKIVADGFKLLSSTGRLIDDVGSYSGQSKVSIASSGGVSMTGDVSASMFGNLSASVTSPVSASLLGGTTSVKGFLWTSVWAGKEVSVKSRGDAKMEAETGKASLKGNAGVEVSSYKGEAVVQGHRLARLSSVLGNAQVYGAGGAYLTTGDSAGWGVIAVPDKHGGSGSARIGRIASSANSFDSDPVGEAKVEFYVDRDETSMRHHDAALALKKGKVYLAVHGVACGITMSDGKVIMDGSRFELG